MLKELAEAAIVLASDLCRRVQVGRRLEQRRLVNFGGLHIAVDPRRAAKNDSLEADDPHGLEHVGRTANVDRFGIVGLLEVIPNIRDRREVDDRIHPVHGHARVVEVQDAPLEELDSLRYQAGQHRVHDPDVDAVGEELAHHVGPDEARSAGHQDSHCNPAFAETRASRRDSVT